MNQRPNFVFIFPDQWRGDCLGVAKHPAVRTPFVDTLAFNGFYFPNSYTPSPTCIPARASLLTGKSPYLCGRTGYQDKVAWRYKDNLLSRLNSGNYQTINVGKTHFYPQTDSHDFEISRLYDPQDHHDGFVSDYHIWLNEQTGGRIRDTAIDFPNNSWVPLPWTYEEYLHPTNWTADTAIEELQQRDKSRPFFIQIGFHRPHPPFDPPIHHLDAYRDVKIPPPTKAEWSERWAKSKVDAPGGIEGRLPEDIQASSQRAYFASLTHVDHQIGKLMYWLRRSGEEANTYIIFASDHGEMLGDHNRRHKAVPFEGSTRIPMIIQPPPSFDCERGLKSDRPVSLPDLMPTILQLAGLELPNGIDSFSLAGELTSPMPGHAASREYIHGEHHPNWQFVTDGREKFIWDSISGEKFFFDLGKDPKETTNLIEDSQHVDRSALWESRLIKELSKSYRHEGLSDGHSLKHGKVLDTVQESFLH